MKWAVLDIETTGLSPNSSDIIDIGFLLFEGTKLIKTFDSLVRTEQQIPRLITHLTGIRQSDMANAPALVDLKEHFTCLRGAKILAHNSDFEQSFLLDRFKEWGLIEGVGKVFHDSIDFLSLIFMGRSQLNLESFIIEFGIADKEVHRGYQDSVDLLKVLFVALEKLNDDPIRRAYLVERLEHFSEDEFAFKFLLSLIDEERALLGRQIGFDPFIESKNRLSKKTSKVDEVYGDKKLGDYQFNGAQIQSLFQQNIDEGSSAKGYEYREAQFNYAKRVGQALKNDLHVLIQAPTGTGKTLGYLLPSALKTSEGSQVLVVTGTKELQQQIIQKDIPLLKSFLGIASDQLKSVKLIGSQNHLCEMIFQSDQNFDLLKFGYEEKFAQLFFQMFFFENSGRKYEEMLTRSDIPFVLKKKFENLYEWERDLTLDYKKCLGKNCDYKKNCSYLQGLLEAKKADIIIGNHSLLLNWPKSIDRPEYLVVDEAHRLSREVSDATTSELEERLLIKVFDDLWRSDLLNHLYVLSPLIQSADKKVDDMERILRGLGEKAKDIVNQLSIHLVSFFQKRPRYTSEFWNEVDLDYLNINGSDKEQFLLLMIQSLSDCIKEIQLVFDPLVEVTSPPEEDPQKKSFLLIENFLLQIDQWSQFLNRFINYQDSLCRVLAFKADEGFVFKLIPIDIGEQVNLNVFQRAESVVMTSATLTASESHLEPIWSTGYNRVLPEKRFKDIFTMPPVYEYEKHAKLLLCPDVPNVFSDEYFTIFSSRIYPLVQGLGGRSLLLFSSRKRFDRAVELALEFFGDEIQVFFQGMGRDTVEKFKLSPKAILIGMESMGEGIDIPGDQLQFVFIDKIPDLPFDSVTKRRRELFDQEFGNEFYHYFLSSRARHLLQKCGRLIRSRKDRGVIMVTDHRLEKWKTGTRQRFMELMQPYRAEMLNLDEAIEKTSQFFQAINQGHPSEVSGLDLNPIVENSGEGDGMIGDNS